MLVDVFATDFSSPSSAWLLAIGGLENVVATGLLVVAVLATGLFVPNKLTPSSAAVKSKNKAFGLPVEGADVMSVSGANDDKVEGGLIEGSNVVIA